MVRKIVLVFLSIVFLLFSYFQVNDPDSIRWVFYYLLLSIMAGLSFFGKNKQVYIIMMGTITILGLVYYFPGFFEWLQDGMPSIVSSMQAESPYIEVVREFLGLLISFVFIAYLFIDQKRQQIPISKN